MAELVLVWKNLFFIGYFIPFRIKFGHKIKCDYDKFGFKMRYWMVSDQKTLKLFSKNWWK